MALHTIATMFLKSHFIYCAKLGHTKFAFKNYIFKSAYSKLASFNSRLQNEGTRKFITFLKERPHNHLVWKPKKQLLQLIFWGSIGPWIKCHPINMILVHLKKFRYTSKRANQRSSKRRQISHSYFSYYKHYSHFSDHRALQALLWIEKCLECCEILHVQSQLSYLSLSTKWSSFQNILTKICSFKVHCFVFPLTQIKFQT